MKVIARKFILFIVTIFHFLAAIVTSNLVNIDLPKQIISRHISEKAKMFSNISSSIKKVRPSKSARTNPTNLPHSGLKGHSHLCDRADLDTSFVSLKSVYVNLKSTEGVEYI